MQFEKLQVKPHKNVVDVGQQLWYSVSSHLVSVLFILLIGIFSSSINFIQARAYKIKRIEILFITGVSIDPEPRVRKSKWTKIYCMKFCKMKCSRFMVASVIPPCFHTYYSLCHPYFLLIFVENFLSLVSALFCIIADRY